MRYQDQRTKPGVPGIPNWAQCFYCSVVMLIDHHLKLANPDAFYLSYFDDVETTYGKAGIGEKTVSREHLVGRSGQYWAVHKDGASKYLAEAGLKAIWADIPWSEAISKLKDGPLVCGTKIPPSDGHIILLKGVSDAGFIVNDPYGDGRTRYSNLAASGEGLVYEAKWLQSVASWNGMARVMWVEKV